MKNKRLARLYDRDRPGTYTYVYVVGQSVRGREWLIVEWETDDGKHRTGEVAVVAASNVKYVDIGIGYNLG